jgi:hypothetical protein
MKTKVLPVATSSLSVRVHCVGARVLPLTKETRHSRWLALRLKSQEIAGLPTDRALLPA